MSRYINPYTDFGFKKLFGEEANKDLLIDFLNQLLPPHHQIKELVLKNNENIPDILTERKAIFDIHCKALSGESFIVEMQKAKVPFFKDRALFYTTFPIREAAKVGEWDFELPPIYMIAILDFKYDEQTERKKFLRHAHLKDQDGETFYDKLQFKFLQMPLFTKTVAELETHFDKWIYFLKELPNFNEIPSILREPIFEKAFNISEIANFTAQQRDDYQLSHLSYLEVVSLKKEMEQAKLEAEQAKQKAEQAEQKAEQAKQEAEQAAYKSKLQFAQMMKLNGESLIKIKQYTGLSDEELENL